MSFEYEEFQATDDGEHVLLAEFDARGEALWLRELTPEAAEALAKQLRDSAGLARASRLDRIAPRQLSDSAVIEVTDFLGMMVKHTRGQS